MLKITKRIIDIILSFAGMIFLFPVFILIALGILLELKEFPFFLQKRGMGINDKLFTIFKFKTLKENKNKNSAGNIFLKPTLQNSIKPFCRWLRKTGLDELPQLLNVFAGHMSFIGPRPLMVEDLQIMKETFPEYYEARQKLKSKPGISGLWQIFGDREKGIENLIGLELIYEEYKSFYMDFKIAIATIPILIWAKNSDAILYNRKSFVSRFIIPFYLSNKNSKIRDGFISSTIAEKINLSDSPGFENYSVSLPDDWWSYIESSISNKKQDSSLRYINNHNNSNSKSA